MKELEARRREVVHQAASGERAVFNAVPTSKHRGLEEEGVDHEAENALGVPLEPSHARSRISMKTSCRARRSLERALSTDRIEPVPGQVA